jgi:4-amino-4-deoxy-L-arabinose transferase-like glycosyltransferase
MMDAAKSYGEQTLMDKANSNPGGWIQKYKFEVIVFVLALVVRLVFIAGFATENRSYDSLFDQEIYLDVARNLMQGNGFALSFPVFTASPGPTSLSPPIYPLLLAGTFGIFGESFVAVRILQAILSALTCVVVYYIGKRTLGENSARVAAVIACFYLPFIMYIRPMMTETMFIFLLALSVLWTLRLFEKLSRVNSLVAGALWAITILARAEGATYMGVMGLYGLVVLWRGRRENRLLGIPYILPGAVVFVLIFLPWVIRNYNIHRAFVPTTTQSGTNIWEMNHLRYYREVDPERYANTNLVPEKIDIPNFDDLTELERDQALSRLAMTFVREHPGQFAYFAVTRVLTSYPLIPRSDEFSPPVRTDGLGTDTLDDFPRYNTLLEQIRVWTFRILFVCAVCGAVIAIRQKKYQVLVLILLVLANIAGAALIRGKERARILSDPYLILMSAEFLIALFYFLRASFRQRERFSKNAN